MVAGTEIYKSNAVIQVTESESINRIAHIPVTTMNTENRQLKLNVGFIAQQSIGYSRNFQFEIPTLVLEPDLNLSEFMGTITVSRTSEGLLFRGKFQADVDATCGRCLSDFKHLLITNFTELYVFHSHAQEDSELIYPEDGQVDLEPIVREYLLLELPINPICKTDCQGLCSICGNNLNHDTCDHGPDPIDPRMSVLKSLLDRD
jgi:uncharacterized protein